MQITSDIELSGAGCTTAITPNQLVQSSSENDSIPLFPGVIMLQKSVANSLLFATIFATKGAP
ncbi:hypothetical protein ACTPUH_006589 [Pseudomonas aeruginosa]